MLEIHTQAHFSAAHYIPWHPHCGEVHGHRWVVEVSYRTIEPIKLDDHGMLVDFGRVKRPIGLLDHPGCCLNDIDGLEQPTAEVLAMWLFTRMPAPSCICLVTVTVWESPDSHARYEDVIHPVHREEEEVDDE